MSFRCWLARTALNIVAPIDFELRSGDFVVNPGWGHQHPMKIIDINWALRAVCVQLAPKGKGIVVGLWSMKKVDPPEDWAKWEHQ